MSDQQPSELDLQPIKRSFWRNLSPLWAVPLLSLVLALGLAWQSFSDRGVLIEILFDEASGVTAGETLIKYRDVTIGEVERVDFTEDLTKVIVYARVNKAVVPYLDEDATFWVVEPEVSARGISGLSTVLSGVYIQGAWDDQIGTAKTTFDGASTPPSVLPNYKGTRITLRAADGQMVSAGAPIFYRGLEVGRLGTPRLTSTGDAILIDAYIDAPHDKLLNSATRFWDTSGFSVSFGSGGLALNVESIATILSGGIAFDSIFENGGSISTSAVFDIYDEEAEARRSIFVGRVQNGVAVSVAFGESVSGLTPGAPVQFAGIEVGEVSEIRAQVNDENPDQAITLLASLNLDPLRLGMPNDATTEETIDFLRVSVENGMRARLATSGIFSSSLIVELVMIDDTPEASLILRGEDEPILPSVRSNIPDFTATAEGMIERINSLPIEELLDQAIKTMASIEDLAADPDLRTVAPATRTLLEDTSALINSPDLQAIPTDLRATITDLRTITEELRSADVSGTLTRALTAAETTANNLSTASENVPALIEDLRTLTAKANSLEAEALITQATTFLASADAVINTDGARALPQSLTDALDEVRLAVAELRGGGAVDNLNAALNSAQAAAESIDVAAEDFRVTMADLPRLSEQLKGVLATAERVIASYGNRSDFSDETIRALRDVSDAARAVEALSRQLERDPTSLLLGR